MKYRNVATGRVIERPSSDEWLEASSGWTREEEPAAPETPAADAEGHEEKEND